MEKALDNTPNEWYNKDVIKRDTEGITMAINTYGLTIKGLKKASGETVNWTRGCCTEIFYDRDTGEVWTVDQVSENSWTEYRNPSIIKICTTSRHMTMQEIADAINRELDYLATGKLEWPEVVYEW